MRVVIHNVTPSTKLTIIQSIQLCSISVTYTTGHVLHVNALCRCQKKKITLEFQTIDSKLTARGAGVDAIGRKLNNAADAFTNIFLHTAMFAQILYRKVGVTKNNSSFICG